MHECAGAGQPDEEKYHFVERIMLAVCIRSIVPSHSWFTQCQASN